MGLTSGGFTVIIPFIYLFTHDSNSFIYIVYKMILAELLFSLEISLYFKFKGYKFEDNSVKIYLQFHLKCLQNNILFY